MRCGDLKEYYLEDEKIFQSLFVELWLVLLFVFLLVFPIDGKRILLLYIANLIGFAIIGAVGLNLLRGSQVRSPWDMRLSSASAVIPLLFS